MSKLYKSYQNGLNYPFIDNQKSSIISNFKEKQFIDNQKSSIISNFKEKQFIDNQKSSIISNFKEKSFWCHIFFLLLLFFQIFSTFLIILISLTFNLKSISAKELKMEKFKNNNNNHSGITSVININNNNKNIDYRYHQYTTEEEKEEEKILLRFRRLLINETLSILTENTVRGVCSRHSDSFIDRFKALKQIRLSYCDMFDTSTVIYPFLMTESDLNIVSSDTRFPTFNFSFRSDDFMGKLPQQLLTLTNSGEIRASLKSSHNLIESLFKTVDNCVEVLMKMVTVDESAREAVLSFKESLVKNHCDLNRKSVRLKWRISCEKCEIAYKNWLCTQYFDMFTSITLPNLDNKEPVSALIGIKSCPAWCAKVETDCVYFTPADTKGGEPAFLCDESHYHHNARYRLLSNAECGADLPWKFCCYSQSLLDKLQNPSSTNDTGVCSSRQYKCLTKIVNATYQMKSLSSQSLNISNIINNSSPSLSFHLNFFLNSFFLYFYKIFSIR